MILPFLERKPMKSMIKKAAPTLVVLLFVLAYEVLIGRRLKQAMNTSASGVFILLLVFSLIALVAVYFSSIERKMAIEHVFLISFLLTGLLYIFVIPPYSAPDEVRHFATVYHYVNPAGAAEKLDSQGKVIVRETDTVLTHKDNYHPTSATYELVGTGLWGEVSKKPVSYSEPPIAAPATAYIPQELACFIGSLLGLSGIMTLYLMKVFMLLAAAVIGFFTIRIAPVGKMTFFTLHFLPMGLSLFTSANYDSTVNALSFLLIAYILKLKYESTKVEMKDYVILFIISVIMVPVKVVYICLLFAAFTVPVSKYGSKWRFCIMNGGLILLNAVVMVIMRLTSLTNLAAGNGTTMESHWALGDILSDIPYSCAMFADSFFRNLSYNYSTMIGTRLGWLELLVPDIIITGITLVMLLAVFSEEKEGEDYKVSAKDRVIYLLIMAVVYSGVCMAMWLDSTPPDSGFIMGVQGRYFIPLLPLGLLCLKNKAVKVKRDVAAYIPFVLVTLNIFAIGNVFEIIAFR